MNIDEMFTVTYYDKKYELLKSSVKFENGYGVVALYVETKNFDEFGWYEEEYKVRGVVDLDFDTVIDLNHFNKDIQIFPKDNILIKIMDEDLDGDQLITRYDTRHFKINAKNSEIICDLNCWDYERIDDTTIKVNNNFILSGFEALYDLKSGKFISEKFTKISKFEQVFEDSEEEFAQAMVILPYVHGKELEVSCYIDRTGQIRSKLCILNEGIYIDTDTDDFDFKKEIDGIKSRINIELTNISLEIRKRTKKIHPLMFSRRSIPHEEVKTID